MQYSVLPSYFTKLFADSGSYNTIPAASQISITPGAASLTDGFPPLTRTPLAAGGVPPFGEDMNGILRWLSQVAQQFQAGGLMPYNSEFATAIGGYPKGALVRKAAGTGYWQCTADSNMTDPDGGSPANWSNVPLLADFGKSLASSGYQKLPSGLILQWGSASMTVSTQSSGWYYGTAVATFPIAFPNACLSVMATPNGASAGTQIAGVNEWSTTGTTIEIDCNLSGLSLSGYYFAIGY